jgi:hypothetical protein
MKTPEQFREEFHELGGKIRRMLRLIKAGLVDKETEQVYYQQIDRWQARQAQIAAVVRV